MRAFKFVSLCVPVFLLAACGGGGYSSGSAGAGMLSFPLQGAYSALIAGGFTKSYTVSGTCSGTATETDTAAAGGATFEGVGGRLSVTTTFMTNYSGCALASGTTTSVSYYDSNYTPLGVNTTGGTYSVFTTPPSFPGSVMVGSTGAIGTITRYTDSSKATVAGHGDFTYIVEADASSMYPVYTDIVNLIDKEFDASNTLTSTQQSRYRIAGTGALTPVSIDIQQANGSTTHLVYQ
jgi:hypothetical protein